MHASADASSSGRQDAAASSSGNSVQEGLGKAATFWKDPTKSQQMEKKWADLRRKRNQSWGFYQRRFVYASLQLSCPPTDPRRYPSKVSDTAVWWGAGHRRWARHWARYWLGCGSC